MPLLSVGLGRLCRQLVAFCCLTTTPLFTEHKCVILSRKLPCRLQSTFLKLMNVPKRLRPNGHSSPTPLGSCSMLTCSSPFVRYEEPREHAAETTGASTPPTLNADASARAHAHIARSECAALGQCPKRVRIVELLWVWVRLDIDNGRRASAGLVHIQL